MTTLECGCRIMEDRITMKHETTNENGNLRCRTYYPRTGDRGCAQKTVHNHCKSNSRVCCILIR